MSTLPQTRLVRYNLLLRSDEALQFASDLRHVAATAISGVKYADQTTAKQVIEQANVMQSVAEQLEKQIV